MADAGPALARREPGPNAAASAPRAGDAAAPHKVVHVVTDLRRGGAETMLARLVAALREKEHEHQVLSLCGEGPLGDELRESGATVRAVDLRSPIAIPGALARLARELRRAGPDLVHCWMYHANLVGGVAARSVARAPIIWGLRSGSPAAAVVGARTALVSRAAAPLSRWLPARVVCPSAATAAAHVASGYARERMEVIPNGFDTALFRPSAELRRLARTALAVEPEELLVGIVANVSPVKDHRTFVAAAARLARDLPNARFVLCGDRATAENRELCGWIGATGVAERFLLLGTRERVHEVLPALDLFTLCSRREAFPNALGEAMACALPCVATDVGGVAELAGPAARLVKPGDPTALAAAWRQTLFAPAEERARLGLAARRRIVDLFSIDAAAARYAELYARLLRDAHAGPADRTRRAIGRR
jgi:glycosyltransferase involved in cell wall biosynthesis